MENLDFIIAGNATFTVENTATQNRFTYKVKAPSITTDKGGRVKDYDSHIRFVSVLTGPDNEEDYRYLGILFTDSLTFRHTKGSKISKGAMSFKAFDYTFEKVADNCLPEQIEIHHKGECGRCGKALTVPESIKSGFGPICAEKVGL